MCLIALQDAEKMQDKARAAGPDGMAETDGAAVYIKTCGIKLTHGTGYPEFISAIALICPGCQTRQHLRGKGFVDLPVVHAIEI